MLFHMRGLGVRLAFGCGGGHRFTRDLRVEPLLRGRENRLQEIVEASLVRRIPYGAEDDRHRRQNDERNRHQPWRFVRMNMRFVETRLPKEGQEDQAEHVIGGDEQPSRSPRRSGDCRNRGKTRLAQAPVMISSFDQNPANGKIPGICK